MNPQRSLTWLFAALLVFGTLAVSGCGSSEDSEEQRGSRWGDRGSGKTPSVEAVQARYGALPLRERMSGTVYARNQVEIYPEISGRVVSVGVENGDRVSSGTPLIRIESEAYQQRVRQAEASLRIARANAQSAEASLEELRSQLRRAERLAENQYQSEEQLESLRAQVQGAEANVEQAKGQVQQAQATLEERRADLQRTIVRAPITGSVGQRDVQIGQRVGPDTQIFTMGDLETVRVEIGVTDRMMGQIRAGQTAQIMVPSLPDTVITAEVNRISPFLSNETFSAEAEIEVPNEQGLLRAGMFVQVDVLYGESQEATIIPLSALYEDPSTGSRGVFVAPTLGTEVPIESPDAYDPNNPPALSAPTPTQFRQVEILAEGQQTAGVRGVEPGDWVITVGQNLLSTSADDRVDARVRALPWSRLMALQRLQDNDLIQRIMKRQQETAAERFGHSPSDPDSPATASPGQQSSDSTNSERDVSVPFPNAPTPASDTSEPDSSEAVYSARR